jgi:hypothetical protein
MFKRSFGMMTKLPDGCYVRDRAGLPHRLVVAGQPLEKCSFVLLAAGVRLQATALHALTTALDAIAGEVRQPVPVCTQS